jgi:uroporphyrinogen-III synthase
MKTPPGTTDQAPADAARAIWETRAARPGRRAPAASFNGRRVLTLESRRAPELALLILNYGGEPFVAPSVREVALESNTAAIDFVHTLCRGGYDMVLLMTGVGTRQLLALADSVVGREPFVRALGASRIVARGPKPVAALREIGLSPSLTVGHPNTWREVLAALDGSASDVPLTNARLAVQEYGLPNPELIEGLEARGARVSSVPIYRWALPEDVAPLESAVTAIIEGGLDAVILTAGVQLAHLLQVATAMGRADETRQGLERMLLASIGPMTSEELRRQGLPIDMESTSAKMGVLVKEAAERCGALLAAKRGGR